MAQEETFVAGSPPGPTYRAVAMGLFGLFLIVVVPKVFMIGALLIISAVAWGIKLGRQAGQKFAIAPEGLTWCAEPQTPWSQIKLICKGYDWEILMGSTLRTLPEVRQRGALFRALVLHAPAECWPPQIRPAQQLRAVSAPEVTGDRQSLEIRLSGHTIRISPQDLIGVELHQILLDADSTIVELILATRETHYRVPVNVMGFERLIALLGTVVPPEVPMYTRGEAQLPRFVD